MEFDTWYDKEAHTCMYRDEEKVATIAEQQPSVIFFYANVEITPWVEVEEKPEATALEKQSCTCNPYFGCSEYAPDCPIHGVGR
jgi:hypothetical protein